MRANPPISSPFDSAFSQLAADNQFATLGIVLLGVLAQIRAACVRLVGDSAAPPPAEAKRPDAESPLHATTATGTSTGGAVVSREEAARAERQRRGKQGVGKVPLPSSVSSSVPRPPPASSTAPCAEPSKKEDDSGGETATTTSTKRPRGQTEEGAGGEEQDIEHAAPPAKKKKKKKKRGDEFDNLFKSLF